MELSISRNVFSICTMQKLKMLKHMTIQIETIRQLRNSELQITLFRKFTKSRLVRIGNHELSTQDPIFNYPTNVTFEIVYVWMFVYSITQKWQNCFILKISEKQRDLLQSFSTDLFYGFSNHTILLSTVVSSYAQ